MSQPDYGIEPFRQFEPEEHMKAARKNDDAVSEAVYRCLKEGVPRLDDLQAQKEIIEQLSKP